MSFTEFLKGLDKSKLADVTAQHELCTQDVLRSLEQKSDLQATFSEAGTLTKVFYKTDARALKAAKLFEESTETLSGFAEARRGAEKGRIDDEKAELDAETARLESELAVAKAQAALDSFLLEGDPEDSSDASDASDSEDDPEDSSGDDDGEESSGDADGENRDMG